MQKGGKVKNLFDLNCEPYSIYETLKDVNKIIPDSFLIGTRIPGWKILWIIK